MTYKFLTSMKLEKRIDLWGNDTSSNAKTYSSLQHASKAHATYPHHLYTYKNATDLFFSVPLLPSIVIVY
ncbi:hypothetical protein RIF29_07899 [Crotalaria pallida]|uniref:Uncharacterized protein n=1 Tax=Crotalaria pallida TaxID=3830 RepID=A0AAN9PB14_CROPI